MSEFKKFIFQCNSIYYQGTLNDYLDEKYADMTPISYVLEDAEIFYILDSDGNYYDLKKIETLYIPEEINKINMWISDGLSISSVVIHSNVTYMTICI